MTQRHVGTLALTCCLLLSASCAEDGADDCRMARDCPARSPTTSTGGTGALPRLELGRACADANDCDSGHCVDGVCCETACDGPCRDCGSDGRCSVQPADDPACGSILCPPSVECRTYEREIRTDRCAALGQCKSSADCLFTNALARTACGDGDICDGQGTCGGRTVACGAISCPVNPGHCCHRSSSGDQICQMDSARCTDADYATSIECDRLSQCPLGQVCCFFGTPGGGPVRCTAECQPGVQVSARQICDPTQVAPTECPSGVCRAEPGLPAGYATCQ